MIVYREQDHAAQTAELTGAISGTFRAVDGVARPGHSLVQELLIAYGEFESAVLDVLMPEHDSGGEECAVLRNAAVACGRLFYRSWRGGDCREASAQFGNTWEAVRELYLPREVRTSVPEGYAFYGLFPESYAKAARRFAREARPQSACVIGIRSIGTSLSAVVAGTLAELGIPVRSFTVRPHGHPFHREVRLAGCLRYEMPHAAAAGHVAIADEGPGLSGSSFLAAIRPARMAGVTEDRIALFPSWEPDGRAFVNEDARTEWPRYRKFTAAYEPPLPAVRLRDLSAGGWRNYVPADAAAMLPSQPQHEARKYLTPDRKLFKFAGLGRYGREKFNAARALASAGYSPPANRLASGFIEYDFVEGRPLSKDDASTSFLDEVARYVAFRGRTFPVSQPSVSFDRMFAMISHNVAETLGSRDTRLETRLGVWRREYERRPAVHVDGRMMPHEWISTLRGWLKTDSVDHSRDHFYPGQADPAWDLAATAIEFQLDAGQKHHLLHRYRMVSGDPIPAGLVNFHEIAYLAFRLGYSSMAADATSGTPDRDRFGALRLAYACFLQERLGVEMNERWIAECK